ncbi:MAG: DinB family protein [Planctomycetaceae bacterium]|nr:DinB family protein [Planctomycetaceae bacterium]
MDSKDLLLTANRQCADLTFPMLDDLADIPLQTAAKDGNHAHWILGHLLLSESGFRAMMEGTPNPRETLRPLFGAGTVPDATGNGYPPYADLLKQLRAAHLETTAWIETLTEAELDQPGKAVPPGFEAFFGTWRQILLMRSLHWMTHRGQLADCRKAAGRSPLMI